MSALTTIDKWLYATLSGDGTLTNLLASATSIYDTQAPQNAARPYVVFDAQVPEDVMGVGTARIMTRADYRVIAVDQAYSPKEVSMVAAQAMADRIDGLLHGVTGQANDYGTMLTCVRDLPLKGIDEGPGGVRYPWAGGVYTIQAQ